MDNWVKTIDFLDKAGLLPVMVLILAIPGGLILFLWGAKKFIFPGFGTVVKTAVVTWFEDQKKRTEIETKLEERLADLTEQLKQLVASNWDNRRYFDSIIDVVKGEHKEIIDQLGTITRLIPKRRTDQE